MSRLVTIRVTPKASAERVEEGIGPDGAPMLKVYVTVPPTDGAANKAVIEALAKHFGVAKSSVEIVQGMTGRNKVVKVGFPKR